MNTNPAGYTYPDYLAHYGVKGMKWGVRRFKEKLADGRQRRMAKHDAKEYARAKMFYGEGAGNRRKLIKNTVEQRRKNDKRYGDYFDKYYSEQDMSKHASAAKRERVARSSAKTTAKTARGIFNAAAGNIGRASAAAAGIYTVARMTGADKKIERAVRKQFSRR